MKITGKYLKILLALSVLLNLLLGYKVMKAKYFSYDPDLTFDRKSLFQHLKMDSSNIVFIGNSLTRQFELAELFKNLNLRNRGINGDNTQGIFNRLQDIVPYQPKKIFIETGINDILLGKEKDTILADYKKILEKLRRDCKATKIYVQSILPVYKNGLAIVRSLAKNETIDDVNKDLQTYCKSRGISFINIHDEFVLNGEMNPKYCIADGLHISGDGYLLWTELLRQYVNE